MKPKKTLVTLPFEQNQNGLVQVTFKLKWATRTSTSLGVLHSTHWVEALALLYAAVFLLGERSSTSSNRLKSRTYGYTAHKAG